MTGTTWAIFDETGNLVCGFDDEREARRELQKYADAHPQRSSEYALFPFVGEKPGIPIFAIGGNPGVVIQGSERAAGDAA